MNLKYLICLNSAQWCLLIWLKYSIGGNRYLIIFTNGKSRFLYIMFAKHQSETFNEYVNLGENITVKCIMILQSDNRREYDLWNVIVFWKLYGIYIQHSLDTNNVAEWLNHTVSKSLHAMLKSAYLSNSLGGVKLLQQELISTVILKYLLQRTSLHMKTGMDRNQMSHISTYLAVYHMFTFPGSCTKSLRKKLAN